MTKSSKTKAKTKTGQSNIAGPKAYSISSPSRLDHAEPSRDCPLCPRLAAFRHANQAREPQWFNAPVPSFGERNASLLIVGLAPGMQGANRTGRPFTGDYAGDLLYETLLEFGYASGVYDERPDDGLTLVDARISNAVRCVPPQNKPLPIEIHTCRQYLGATLDEMPNLRAIVMLGRVSHDSTLKALRIGAKDAPFSHGAEFQSSNIRLFDSYHCSRYNTNTRRLTPAMFKAVFASVREYLAN